ncbi:GDP-L-fucose synthase family protein [Candidatus Symbiothrix dinenymphae]|uniref:GDP-L-fucose synthase family protein n=1 Tax=Candidatus Symbiothrix dinenymphae TaxID=467085 RepID=UPI0006C1E876|nr:GDP-L-fucose synthase [Candidatus Symbiothrix dinenymphae]GAP73405.1 GDP-4-keto-6-deoxy-D-mannose-3 [Candidatus Symbiothrix dinenymphae]
MDKNAKIYVAGHRGLVGSAILKNLQVRGFSNFVVRTHQELDLIKQQAVFDFFEAEKPAYVFLAAAHVGGIIANSTYRGQFIYDNLQIQNNVIHASYLNDVKKLLFLGSTCIYPGDAPQPMPENCLLTSPLEYTNEPYALAKIAGIKICESYNLQYGTNYIAVMPTNLYGPNDNFDLEKSHVLPALLRKVYLAKSLMTDDWEAIRNDLNALPIEGVSGKDSQEAIEGKLQKYGILKTGVEIWGSGKPMREFLWSEEMADASVFVMEKVDFKDLKPASKEIRNTHINIGTGEEISIAELANIIAQTVGYQGKFVFNTDKPDGTMRKLTDVTKLHELGWKHQIGIRQGVEMLYRWYCERLK